jgi:hypothetical protein
MGVQQETLEVPAMNSDDMTALAENASTVARAIRISREARAGDAFAPRPDLEAEAQALFAEFDGAKPAGAATRRRSAYLGAALALGTAPMAGNAVAGRGRRWG